MTPQDRNVGIGGDFLQEPETPPRMVNGTLTDGAGLGSTLQALATTYSDLWIGLAGAHLRCGGDLMRDLSVCKSGEEVLNAYVVYAASTLRHCESELAALMETSLRARNRAVGASLQSMLAARPSFELPADSVTASTPQEPRSTKAG
ncbi:MAG: hypothetical protein F9K29_00215 [Hyphomicrobiaceae bacterium]|nr:MAG: hypothetical protein F9K29_00215 [Hyphomicrobiaceae bacterium]